MVAIGCLALPFDLCFERIVSRCVSLSETTALTFTGALLSNGPFVYNLSVFAVIFCRSQPAKPLVILI